MFRHVLAILSTTLSLMYPQISFSTCVINIVTDELSNTITYDLLGRVRYKEDHADHKATYTVTTGSAKIETFEKQRGEFCYAFLNDPNSNHQPRVAAVTNLELQYKFLGQSTRVNRVKSTGSFLNYEWKDLHPEGYIRIKFVANRMRGLNVFIDLTTYKNHDDRPNAFVEAIAAEFREEIMHSIRNNLSKYGFHDEQIILS